MVLELEKVVLGQEKVVLELEKVVCMEKIELVSGQDDYMKNVENFYLHIH